VASNDPGSVSFKINSTIVREGSVHFRAYQAQKPIDIYISHLNGSIDDLTNISQMKPLPLVANVQASGLVMMRPRSNSR